LAEHILVAGRESVGKSTTAANLAAALAENDHNVAMIGYDPRHVSTVALRGGSKLMPFTENSDGKDDIRFTIGYKHSLCVEVGELTKENSSDLFTSRLNSLITSYNPHYVIHDLWHQPNGSFVLPPICHTSPRLLAVSSGDLASIQTVNLLFRWLNNL